MIAKRTRYWGFSSLVVLLLAALWSLAGYQAYVEREAVIAAKQMELKRLVVAVEEQTLRLFKLTEATAIATSHWIEEHPGIYPGQDASFIALVSRLRQLSDDTIEVRIIDRKGGAHVVPAATQGPVADLSGREHFRIQKNPRTSGLFISNPVLSQVNGQWVVPVTYPIHKGDGRFAAVAVAIQLDRIIQPFEAQRQRPNGSITLMKSNGITLLRTPGVKGVFGKSIATAPDFIEHLSVKERGIYRVKGAYDGVERMVGHVRLAGYPVIVAVTASIDDVLAPWRHQLEQMILLMSLVTAAAFSFTFRFMRADRVAQDRLAQSEHRFRTLIEHAPDAIVVFDVDAQRIIDANPKAETLFQCTREELFSDGIERFYAPIQPDGLPAADSIRQAHERALRGEPVLIEWSIRHASGGNLTVEARVDNLSEGCRHLVRGSYIDISKRKRAELALRESEAQLRLLVETSPLPMIVATLPPRARVMMLNKSFIRRFGYTIEDMPSLATWWPRIYPDPVYRHEVQQRWQEAMQRMIGANRHSFDKPFSTELTCRDGTRRFVEIDMSMQADRCLVIFHDVTERHTNEQHLAHIAYYDPLTRLPNRRLLTDRMDQAIARSLRNGKMLAVCYLDLDLFKPVNDQYGHQAGDRVLVEAATRMGESIRAGDTAARLGGDEFVLLLVDLDCFGECEQVMARVIASLAIPFDLERNISVGLAASIGVAMLPGDGQTSEELLRNADRAMYAAKQAGRNRITYFASI